MRRAADVLSASADWHRSQLVNQLGFKRYIFSVLGAAARESAAGCQLLWPGGATEPVLNASTPLGDYLATRTEEEQDLPQAVITADGKKYYL